MKALLHICAFLAGLWAQGVLAQPVDRVVAAHYPPLMMQGDPGQPGYAIEVLEAAAQRAGRRIEVTFLPFTRAMAEVRKGPRTLMPALFFGKEPSADYLWLAEIQTAQMSFATLTGRIDDLSSARGLQAVVVEQGTTADLYLSRQGFTNLVRVSTPEASARMLQAGRVDAWMLEETLAAAEWRRLAFPEKLSFGAVVFEVPIFLVASPDLPAGVATQYRKAMADLRADGTLSTLWNRYTTR